jgi:hypothetical protein
MDDEREEMVKRILMCFILVMMSLAVQAQTSNKTSGGVEKAVAALEQQWVAAAKTGNIDFIAALVADNFSSLDSDGTTHNKAEYLETHPESPPGDRALG